MAKLISKAKKQKFSGTFAPFFICPARILLQITTVSVGVTKTKLIVCWEVWREGEGEGATPHQRGASFLRCAGQHRQSGGGVERHHLNHRLQHRPTPPPPSTSSSTSSILHPTPPTSPPWTVRPTRTQNCRAGEYKQCWKASNHP